MAWAMNQTTQDAVTTLRKQICWARDNRCAFHLVGLHNKLWITPELKSLCAEFDLQFSTHKWCQWTSLPLDVKYVVASTIRLGCSRCPNHSSHVTLSSAATSQGTTPGQFRACAEKQAFTGLLAHCGLHSRSAATELDSTSPTPHLHSAVSSPSRLGAGAADAGGALEFTTDTTDARLGEAESAAQRALEADP
eukprot:6173754-Amphidinium_carterae.1